MESAEVGFRWWEKEKTSPGGGCCGGVLLHEEMCDRHGLRVGRINRAAERIFDGDAVLRGQRRRNALESKTKS